MRSVPTQGCVGSPPTLSLGAAFDPGAGSDAGADGSCLQPSNAREASRDAYTKFFFIEGSPEDVELRSWRRRSGRRFLEMSGHAISSVQGKTQAMLKACFK